VRPLLPVALVVGLLVEAHIPGTFTIQTEQRLVLLKENFCTQLRVVVVVTLGAKRCLGLPVVVLQIWVPVVLDVCFAVAEPD